MLHLLLALIISTSLSGAPSGTLRDPSGRVLPGAVVRLAAIGSDAVYETTSGPDGAFQFGEVPDGDYMMSARLPGFLGSRQRIRVISAMQPMDFTVPVATLHENITIRGASGAHPATSGASGARPQPAKPACGTAEVGGNLKPPMKLKDVRPRYKQELIDSNVSGTVLLHAVIDTNGKVRQIEVVSPRSADLEEAAIEAVSQWEFSPTYLNCEPIEVRMFVTANFIVER
jgi:TonB family protein